MTKQIIGSFVGTLAAGTLIVVGTKALGPIPLSISQTTTNKQSTFDVSGQGEVTTAPDRAEINLGIQFTENTVARAQEKGNQTINKITEDLKALGIEKADIKTINYSLYPSYDYQGGQRITGYNLNVSLQVKIKDFTKITQVVDTSTKDGANQVGGISFTLSDEKKQDVENQVREQAVKRAKEKADTLSRISGVRLGKIVNVIENGNSPGPYPYLMAEKAMNRPADMTGGSAGSPTNVEPGNTTFTMTVTLSYETL
jgi:uncharacterized protein